VSIDELENLSNALLKWNQKYSILTSINTEQILHDLYTYFSAMKQDELKTLVNDQVSLSKFKDKLLKFYLALKGDLGTYALISPATITGFKLPKNIQEVAYLFKQLSNKKK